MKRVFIGIIFLIVGIAFLARFYLPVKIVATPDGFVPAQVNIRVGQKVVFLNRSGKSFWPASDLHPTHSVLPDFDPRKPVEDGQSWSFVFHEKGVWNFHDHLLPTHIGTIIVGGQDSIANQDYSNYCEFADNKKLCFERLVDKELEESGIDKAFDVVAQLFATTPEFASICHDVVHKLGESAYQKYKDTQEASISSKSSYCGYGFYHGFMETLLTTGGNINEARDYCEQVEQNLSSVSMDAGGACYHGIGHGVSDQHDAKSAKSWQEFISPALQICEKLSSDSQKIWRCATGVYNAAEIAASSEDFAFVIDKNNPFSVCNTQPEIYQSACFPNLVPQVINLAKGNFSSALQYLSHIQKEDLYKEALTSIAVEEAKLRGPYASVLGDSIEICRNQPSQFINTCISSLAEGLLKHGSPGNEYIETFKFCSLDNLSKVERKLCFERVISILPIWYSRDTRQEICKAIDSQYFNSCAK
jgi:hypothetical protein